MQDHVYLDDRDMATVVRSMEADLKALTALCAATLRTLAATSPAVSRAADQTLRQEAAQAQQVDPATAAHVRSMLDALGLRLSAANGAAQSVNDLEWTLIDPARSESSGA